MFQKKLSFFTKGFQNKFWTICLKVQQHLFWQVSWKERYTKNSIHCLSILVESPNASELKLVLRMYTLQCTVYTDIYINISNLKSACPSICPFVCNLIKLIMDIVKYLDGALVQKIQNTVFLNVLKFLLWGYSHNIGWNFLCLNCVIMKHSILTTIVGHETRRVCRDPRYNLKSLAFLCFKREKMGQNATSGIAGFTPS